MFGQPGCDNHVVYLLNYLGYNLYNQPTIIKSYHYHQIRFPYYCDRLQRHNMTLNPCLKYNVINRYNEHIITNLFEFNNDDLVTYRFKSVTSQNILLNNFSLPFLQKKLEKCIKKNKLEKKNKILEVINHIKLMKSYFKEYKLINVNYIRESNFIFEMSFSKKDIETETGIVPRSFDNYFDIN